MVRSLSLVTRFSVILALVCPSFVPCDFPEASEISSDPVLVVLNVADTAVVASHTGAFVTVSLDNFYDTIAGFQFQLRLDRPDLLQFDWQRGGFDTTATLLSGFEYVQAVDTGGSDELLWFRCIANSNPFDGHNTPGIPPQQGGVAVRIPVLVPPEPDLTNGATCDLTIVPPFDFSDPWANSLGVITDTLTDTIYLQCRVWEADSCAEWLMVDGNTSPYDSVHIYDYLVGYLDTTVVIPGHGSVTIIEGELVCDNNLTGDINIADITCLVSYLFAQWDQQSCPSVEKCVVDGSPTPNVSALTRLVEYLFRGGVAP